MTPRKKKGKTAEGWSFQPWAPAEESPASIPPFVCVHPPVVVTTSPATLQPWTVPTSLAEAVSLYQAPAGYRWRRVVVDACNLLCKHLLREWMTSGQAGALLAEFALFLTRIGCSSIWFILRRRDVEKWISLDETPKMRADRDIFIWLLRAGFIAIAPSWSTPFELKQQGAKLKWPETPGASLSPYDDLIVVKMAAALDGVIISNDQFRDHKRYYSHQQLTKFRRFYVDRRIDVTRKGQDFWHLETGHSSFREKRILPFYTALLNNNSRSNESYNEQDEEQDHNE